MASMQCLIATLLLLSLMHAGSTLKCYNCVEDTGEDGICRDTRGVEDATVDCSQSCITHTVDSATGEVVMRVCAGPSFCQTAAYLVEKQTGFKTKTCTVCDSDRCN